MIVFQNETLWKTLSQASLLLAPPGHSRTSAHAILKATHEPADKVRPAAGKKPAAKTKQPER